MFDGKIRAERSVLQELCHFVIPPDKTRISTGDVTHEFRTNRMLTDRDCTSNGCLCPFCLVEIFEHIQNFPPDRTDTIGHRRTRRGFTRYELTQTDEMIFLSFTRPLARCDQSFSRLAFVLPGRNCVDLEFYFRVGGIQLQIRVGQTKFSKPIPWKIEGRGVRPQNPFLGKIGGGGVRPLVPSPPLWIRTWWKPQRQVFS